MNLPQLEVLPLGKRTLTGIHARQKIDELNKKRVCTSCGEQKDYFFSHVTGIKKRFRDEDGGLWFGRSCGPCHYYKHSRHSRLVNAETT